MAIESYQYLLGAFKCAELIHHRNHLIAKGNYSDHLLLGEIYESYTKYFDSFAEKGIVIYGEEVVNLEIILKMQMMCYQNQNVTTDAIKTSLSIEEYIVSELDELYEELKQSENLTLGLDDLIMSTSSEVEDNIYLLTQRSKG